MTADPHHTTCVMFLLDQLYSGRGGSEQHLLWLQQRLCDRRFEKRFVVMTAVRRCDPRSLPLCPYILSDDCGMGKRYWFRRLRRLASLINQWQIDVIHTFCPSSEHFAVFATMLAGRGRVIGSRRNTGYALRLRDRLFSRGFTSRIAGYVANSEAAKRVAVERERIPEERITVIPNPVFESRIDAGMAELVPRKTLASFSEDPIVGMVATIRPVKDHLTLILAARRVVDRFPRASFVLVGEADNTYLNKVKALVTELNLMENVVFYGGVDNPFRLIPHFDVGVLSSQSESFSNSVLEYAAAGIPSVVTDVGGLREIIRDGENGFVVPPSDPVSLAEKICAIIESAELRNRLGRTGQRYVRTRFGEQRILDQYCKVYGNSVFESGLSEMDSI